MEPQLQGLEPARCDHELTIEHEVRPGEPSQSCGDLGKVALERLSVLRLQVYVPPADMRQAAEPIVFRLVLPSVPGRELLHGFGFHRHQVEREGGQ